MKNDLTSGSIRGQFYRLVRPALFGTRWLEKMRPYAFRRRAKEEVTTGLCSTLEPNGPEFEEVPQDLAYVDDLGDGVSTGVCTFSIRVEERKISDRLAKEHLLGRQLPVDKDSLFEAKEELRSTVAPKISVYSGCLFPDWDEPKGGSSWVYLASNSMPSPAWTASFLLGVFGPASLEPLVYPNDLVSGQVLLNDVVRHFMANEEPDREKAVDIGHGVRLCEMVIEGPSARMMSFDMKHEDAKSLIRVVTRKDGWGVKSARVAVRVYGEEISLNLGPDGLSSAVPKAARLGLLNERICRRMRDLHTACEQVKTAVMEIHEQQEG